MPYYEKTVEPTPQPNARLHHYAAALLHKSPLANLKESDIKFSPSLPPIRIVCISDTHNTQPLLPAGDILIHAGNLTENGSFPEVQAQLKWLALQPHAHKIVVAGTHDALLDEAFLHRHPERRFGDHRTSRDLVWGGVKYLDDASVMVEVELSKAAQGVGVGVETEKAEKGVVKRVLRIYGNPRTPQTDMEVLPFRTPLGVDIWAGRVPVGTDVVVAHGPAYLHLDELREECEGRVGCPYLAREIARVRPRMVVSGMAYDSYGREEVVFDGVRRNFEEIMQDRKGWGAYGKMMLGVGWKWMRRVVYGKKKLIEKEEVTTVVNAALVRDGLTCERNPPIVVDI